jgi:hypothetical protein
VLVCGALLVPLAFFAAAFTGALGPGMRLDGTADHVALVFVTAEVSALDDPTVTGAAPFDPVSFPWCRSGWKDGNRLVWHEEWDPRTTVVVLIHYSGSQLSGHEGTDVFHLLQPGEALAVRPALRLAPPLYSIRADLTVETAPGLAQPAGPDGFSASYNVTNMTVTETHGLVTGYGVPVVRQPHGICD